MRDNMCTAIQNEVLYQVGWEGLIGSIYVRIVEVRIGTIMTIKKAIRMEME
jgi:hypothetical protein